MSRATTLPEPLDTPRSTTFGTEDRLAVAGLVLLATFQSLFGLGEKVADAPMSYALGFGLSLMVRWLLWDVFYVLCLHAGVKLFRGEGMMGDTFRGIGRALLWPAVVGSPVVVFYEAVGGTESPWSPIALLLLPVVVCWGCLAMILSLRKKHQIHLGRAFFGFLVPIGLVGILVVASRFL